MESEEKTEEKRRDQAKIEETNKLQILKATAVRAAMNEVVSENRAEIIKRARAKLTALGVELGAEHEPQV